MIRQMMDGQLLKTFKMVRYSFTRNPNQINILILILYEYVYKKLFVTNKLLDLWGLS